MSIAPHNPVSHADNDLEYGTSIYYREDISIKNGTLVCSEEEIMENIRVVKGVAYSRDEAKMTLVSAELN